MGLSVASLNPINSMTYVTAKPQAYSIDSEAAVSSAYRESIGNASTPEAVRGPAPVRYANTRYDVSSGVESMRANQRANRAYNQIASSFGGVTTAYDRGGEAYGYASYGQNIDAFA